MSSLETKLQLENLPEFQKLALETEDEVEEDLPTFEHGLICANLSRELGNFLKGKNLGRVVDSTPEYRFLTRKSKKPGRYPDVSFVRQERLPTNFRTYPTIAPDLAIEVVSPSDKEYEVEAKVKEYQQAGVMLVWVVYPFSQRIDVYRLQTGLIPQSIGATGALSGESVIPGFTLAISEIFDYPPLPLESDETDLE